MKSLSNNWYNLTLSILFWIFAWNLHNAIMDKFNLTDNQYIIANVVLLIIVIILITYNKSYFA